MTKQYQINKRTETQEATAAAGGASTGAFSGPFMNLIKREMPEGLNLPKKEIDEIPIYDAETNEELTRVNPNILDALWKDDLVFNDGKHWVTDMGWNELSNILVDLKDLNEGLNLSKKKEPEPLNWHQIYNALYNLDFDEEGLEEVCNSYGVSTIQANGNGPIDYNFTLEELTDYFQQHPDEFREFMENIQNMDNTDQIIHEEMVNLYDEKKGIKITNQDLEAEIDEGTDIASVGAGGHGSGFAYIDPYGKGYHKEKNWGTWAKNEESMRWNKKPFWPGGSFVTVKKKCQKFPYCNQGDTGALNFSNPKIVKSHALSEGLNLPKKPQPKQYGTAIYASEDIDIPVKYVNNYVLEKLQNYDKIFRVSDA